MTDPAPSGKGEVSASIIDSTQSPRWNGPRERRVAPAGLTLETGERKRSAGVKPPRVLPKGTSPYVCPWKWGFHILIG